MSSTDTYVNQILVLDKTLRNYYNKTPHNLHSQSKNQQDKYKKQYKIEIKKWKDTLFSIKRDKDAADAADKAANMPRNATAMNMFMYQIIL